MIELAWPAVALVAIAAASFFAWRLIPRNGLGRKLDSWIAEFQKERAQRMDFMNATCSDLHDIRQKVDVMSKRIEGEQLQKLARVGR